MSVQGKCRYIHSNSRKGDHYLGRNMIKIRVFLYILGNRKKILLESSYCIETYIDVFVEVFEI